MTVQDSSDPISPSQVLRPWDEIDFTAIALILFGAWLAVTTFERLVRWISPRLPTRVRFYLLPWPPIVRLALLVATVVIVVPMVLVPRTESMIAIIGSGAVAIGFAFKDYISSLLAGVVVLFERPCSVGDWVRIGDVYGRVEVMRLRVLELVTPDDDRVAIPYSRIWDDPVFSANGGRPDHLCVAEFMVDAEHDGRVVREVLEDVALTSAYRNLARPVTVVAAEQPYGTRYRVKAYPFDGADQFTFVTDITLRGKRALEALGVRPARAVFSPDAATGGA